MRTDKFKYSVVLVVHVSDWDLAQKNIPVIYRFLKPRQIIVIASRNVEGRIKRMGLDYVKFLDEDKVFPALTYNGVSQVIRERCPSSNRAGWYFQQFLKMAYAVRCEEEWYMVWDTDTIPLKNIPFFTHDKKGILDIKTEYHRPYFGTMKRLIGLDKQIRESFISEHMLINKEAMMKLIKKIEDNNEIQGTAFFEKILYAVRIWDLKANGYSEYETYGNFVMHNYQDMYTIRKLRTLREGKILLGDCVSKKILKWAGNSYDIISFEKYHRTDPAFYKCTHSFLRYFISMKSMWWIYKRIHIGSYNE